MLQSAPRSTPHLDSFRHPYDLHSRQHLAPPGSQPFHARSHGRLFGGDGGALPYPHGGLGGSSMPSFEQMQHDALVGTDAHDALSDTHSMREGPFALVQLLGLMQQRHGMRGGDPQLAHLAPNDNTRAKHMAGQQPSLVAHEGGAAHAAPPGVAGCSLQLTPPPVDGAA